MKLYRIGIEVAQAIDGNGNIAWDTVNRPEIYGSGRDIEDVNDLVEAGKINDLDEIVDNDSQVRSNLNIEEMNILPGKLIVTNKETNK